MKKALNVIIIFLLILSCKNSYKDFDIKGSWQCIDVGYKEFYISDDTIQFWSQIMVPWLPRYSRDGNVITIYPPHDIGPVTENKFEVINDTCFIFYMKDWEYYGDSLGTKFKKTKKLKLYKIKTDEFTADKLNIDSLYILKDSGWEKSKELKKFDQAFWKRMLKFEEKYREQDEL